MKKVISIIITAFILGTLSFFYISYRAKYSVGFQKDTIIFTIKKGEGNWQIARRLQEEGLVSRKTYFYYYMRMNNLTSKILPGDYLLSGNMTIGEIAKIITSDQDKSVKVTFPEGFNIKDMAQRLNENGLPGDEFLTLTNQAPQEILGRYESTSVLLPNSSLEGFLFPDTYFFDKKATAQGIIFKMLDNLEEKLNSDLKSAIKNQNKSIYEIVTMASIIEKEVNNNKDRKTVSGIFWNRIENNHALQSCATIGYVLGEDKKQYSFEDTRVPSPYNTYLNTGLPKGPISNPGLASIEAAIYPEKTNYNYFLNDPETKTIIYSKTIEEHNANKAKYGL